jgi:hypothetical protein
MFNNTISIRKRSRNDIAFTEFDRNSNFIHDDILPDFVARSKNHENCSDEIVDSLMEQ